MKLIAALSYFPVFGWFFPMFLFFKNELCHFHAKQGFVSLLFFLITFSLVWLFSHLIPDFLEFFELILYGIVVFLYLVLLFLGFITSLKGRMKPLPVIGKKAIKLPI